jgi:ubiquinone/menaquinone biosynthesis C-methylase UbiE
MSVCQPVDRLPYFDMILGRLHEGDSDFTLAFGRHVHWGYWENPAQADGTVVDFARAAERLCRRLLAAAAITDGQDILDAGCGFGGTVATLDDLFSSVRLTGLNTDERQLERASAQVQARSGNSIRFVHGDACALPFANGSFDHVLAVECIFHFPSRVRFFHEARRVLRPGGRLTLSDFTQMAPPTPASFSAAQQLVERVTRIYGPSSFQTVEAYRRLAQETGFEPTVEDDLTHGILPSYPVARRLLGRVSEEAAWATEMIEAELATEVSRYLILSFDRQR